MSQLFIVATPLGNTSDISARALDTLASVDLILAEDTRVTRNLLTKYPGRQFKAEVFRLDEHIRGERLDQLADRIAAGQSAAMVSSAGTPQVSDPGESIVEACVARGVTIVPVPGASALATILSVANFVAEPTAFVGFLPKKKGRQTMLESIKTASGKHGLQAMVLYESPYHVLRTFAELAERFGADTKVVVGRELTKHFEEVWYGTVTDAITHFAKPKGEFTLLVQTVTPR